MFGGRERLHRQGVDLLAHSIAEGRVHPLVAPHARQAFEFGRDDGGEEVAAIAFDFADGAGQPGGDEVADLGGRCGPKTRWTSPAASTQSKAPLNPGRPGPSRCEY